MAYLHFTLNGAVLCLGGLICTTMSAPIDNIQANLCYNASPEFSEDEIFGNNDIPESTVNEEVICDLLHPLRDATKVAQSCKSKLKIDSLDVKDYGPITNFPEPRSWGSGRRTKLEDSLKQDSDRLFTLYIFVKEATTRNRDTCSVSELNAHLKAFLCKLYTERIRISTELLSELSGNLIYRMNETRSWQTVHEKHKGDYIMFSETVSVLESVLDEYTSLRNGKCKLPSN